MAFDGDMYYTGYQGLQADDEPMLKTKNTEVLKMFASFIKEWNVNGEYIYKNQLKANIALHKHFLKVNLSDIEQFDHGLCNFIRERPIRLMSILENALLEAYTSMNAHELEGPVDHNVKHIQLQISSTENIQQLRTLTTQSLGKLINVTGIIINSGKTSLRGRRVKAVCKDCHNTKFFELSTGFEGVNLPRFCEKSAPG